MNKASKKKLNESISSSKKILLPKIENNKQKITSPNKQQFTFNPNTNTNIKMNHLFQML